MEEITFGDILLHYSQKLKEVFEDVEEIQKLLTNSRGIVEGSWKGNAANACTTKLEDLTVAYTKVNSELSDSITKLTGLIEEYEETENQINQALINETVN
jgi:hypothetical protein